MYLNTKDLDKIHYKTKAYILCAWNLKGGTEYVTFWRFMRARTTVACKIYICTCSCQLSSHGSAPRSFAGSLWLSFAFCRLALSNVSLWPVPCFLTSVWLNTIIIIIINIICYCYTLGIHYSRMYSFYICLYEYDCIRPDHASLPCLWWID